MLERVGKVRMFFVFLRLVLNVDSPIGKRSRSGVCWEAKQASGEQNAKIAYFAVEGSGSRCAPGAHAGS